MDTKPATRHPLVQLLPRRLPVSKPCAAAPPSTSSMPSRCSSCSDNESVGGGDMDCSAEGWPSTLSVLETPERRRLRRLVKTNKNNNPVIQNLINEEGNSLLHLDTSYMSSPPMKLNMGHVFSPPTLKTPTAQRLKNVHISCSPMRSFYCRQSPTTQKRPRLSNNTGSSSGRVPLGRVNRVLELPLPSGNSSSSYSNHSQLQQQQENVVSSSSIEWPREESGYASSLDFNSSSRLEDLSSNLAFDHTTNHVETPSKGLEGTMDSDCSLEFGVGMSSLGMNSSTPLKDSSNLLLSLNLGFIPEQASGPLEASVLDGINPLLNNFFLLPSVPSTSPAPTISSLKRKLDDHPYPAICISEEMPAAKKCALTRFRKAKSTEMTARNTSLNPSAPSFDDGVDENALPAEKNVVSSLGEDKWRLLVGETPDQLLVTSWAKAFLGRHQQPAARQQAESLRQPTRHTLAAGLAPYYFESDRHYYYKLD